MFHKAVELGLTERQTQIVLKSLGRQLLAEVQAGGDCHTSGDYIMEIEHQSTARVIESLINSLAYQVLHTNQ
jgi:hypothetical protein